jgi:hypothetical protein
MKTPSMLEIMQGDRKIRVLLMKDLFDLAWGRSMYLLYSFSIERPD